MYARRCYQQLDEPLLVCFGLQFHEVVVVTAVGILVAFFSALFFGLGAIGMGGILLGVALSMGLMRLFRGLRKGAPGYIVSRLYRYRIFEILPPGMRPRHLVPIPTASRVGGCLRLSAVEGSDDEDRRTRHAYFIRH